jgi:hypothetical protein
MNITSEHITKLEENQIFVFGSNLLDVHGKGAAKDGSIKRTLSIDEIKPFVDEFIEFAKSNENLIFLVTEIGTGLANHRKENIAPLFKEAINCQNIYLSKDFWNILLRT